jgi:hypothetical protein
MKTRRILVTIVLALNLLAVAAWADVPLSYSGSVSAAEQTFRVSNGYDAQQTTAAMSGGETGGAACATKPAYDSGWVPTPWGSPSQTVSVQLTHHVGGNVDGYIVDLQMQTDTIAGLQPPTNRGLGTTFYYSGLTTTSITLWGPASAVDAGTYLRVRIWRADCSSGSDIPLLVDGDFNASSDSTALRANATDQDWYESARDYPTLLTLESTNVGGNTSKKAKLSSCTVGRAYLTQEFSTPQTGQVSVQWDIYVDSILDRPNSTYDRAAWMFIGDDTGTTPDRLGPNAEDSERFVYLGFYKPGGGSSGTMDLVARESSTTETTFATVATGLSLKHWYTIQVICDLAQDTYDVYVDGLLQATVKARTPKDRVTHVSFGQWSQDEGTATFYVDNVTADAP